LSNMSQAELEQALIAVEDETDVQAMKQAKTEISQELADFDQDAPFPEAGGNDLTERDPSQAVEDGNLNEDSGHQTREGQCRFSSSSSSSLLCPFHLPFFFLFFFFLLLFLQPLPHLF